MSRLRTAADLVALGTTLVLAQFEGGDSGVGEGPGVGEILLVGLAILAFGVAVGLTVRLRRRIRDEREVERRTRSRQQ